MGPRQPSLLQVHSKVSRYKSQISLRLAHLRYMLTATPGIEKVPVEGTCFQSVELSSKTLESGDVEVTLHLGLPTSLLCHASFILATDKHIELEEVALNNVHSLINLLQLCY